MRISCMTKDGPVSSIVDYGTSFGKYTSSVEGGNTNYSYFLYKSANVHHVVIGPLEDGMVVLTRNETANEHVVHHVNGNNNGITMVALESTTVVSNGG